MKRALTPMDIEPMMSARIEFKSILTNPHVRIRNAILGARRQASFATCRRAIYVSRQVRCGPTN